MLQWTPGCVCVCVCVCVSVCVISTAQTDGQILMKLSTNHLLHHVHVMMYIFVRSFFLRFWNSNFMMSWQQFCVFSDAILSQSQFCSDFLQIIGRERRMSSGVCDKLKSTKSVDKFGSYDWQRFRKIQNIRRKQNLWNWAGTLEYQISDQVAYSFSKCWCLVL